MLFWGEGFEDGSKPFAERREDGTVVFYADIVASAAFMLSRAEEINSNKLDAHNRFPATESAAFRHNFLDRPIIDEYAMILQEWIKTVLPGWEPKPKKFRVQLSHDIDHILRCGTTYETARAIAGDFIKRRDWRAGLSNIRPWFHPGKDPYLQGILHLADLSEQYGFRSHFYFKASEKAPFDTGYDPAHPLLKPLIDHLGERGHEIGFHPGYHTPEDPVRFAREKERLEAAFGRRVTGGRQHYLRFRAPDTWRIWEENGMEYDSTLGYADHEGFRCGTCHPYRPWDIERGREMNLWEVPLIVMDGTLKNYRGMTPERGEERILTLARRCKQVGGVFTLLWHNTALFNDWKPWADMYRRVLPKLAEMVD